MIPMHDEVATDRNLRAAVFGAFGNDWLLEELPGVLASDEFLQRFLRIFQDIADTVRWPADNLGQYVDTSVAPMEFVHWLGKWLDLDVDQSWDEVRQRKFVREVGPLFRRRGTPKGLAEHLAAVTNGRVQVRESGGVSTTQTPFDDQARYSPVNRGRAHITIETRGQLSLEAMTSLIATLMPADVIFELAEDSALGTKTPGDRS